jgi:hypothetical protein
MDRAALEKTVMDLANNVGKDVAKELEEYVEDGRLAYLDAYITKIAKYKALALAAESAEDAKMYAEQAEVVTLSLEHNLVQEKIIAEAKMAAIIKKAIMGAVAAFGVAVKELVALAAKGMVKGAIEGLKGGMGGIAPK